MGWSDAPRTGAEIGLAQQDGLDRTAGGPLPDHVLDLGAVRLEGVQRPRAAEVALEAVVQDLLAHDGADAAAAGQSDPEPHRTGVRVEEWLRGQGVGRDLLHGGTLAHSGPFVGALAHMGRRIGWPGALALATLCTLAVAYLQVVSAGSRQSAQRERAQAALNAAGASCEALATHQERAQCRAALQPLPRENAALPSWSPLGP